MYCPLPYRIEDSRSLRELKTESFNRFKKKDLYKFLQNQLLKKNVDNANYWCCECIMSGYFSDINEKILDIYIGHINWANPYLVVFLWKYFERFTIVANTYTEPINIRDDMEIRNMMSTVVSVVSVSKNNILPKMPKIHDIDIQSFPKIRIQFKELKNIVPFMKKEDPKEVLYLANELLNYLITQKKNAFENIVYWISWLISWESNYKKQNDLGPMDERPNPKIDKIYWKDSVWLLWEIVQNQAGEQYRAVVDACFRFYQYYYNKKNSTKKIGLLIMCFWLLVHKPEINRNIYGRDYDKVILACGNINVLYKYIQVNLDNGSNTVEK